MHKVKKFKIKDNILKCEVFFKIVFILICHICLFIFLFVSSLYFSFLFYKGKSLITIINNI